MAIDSYRLAQLDVVTEAMYGGASQEPDGIEFAWWNDEQLEAFAKSDKVLRLSEDDMEHLLYELEKRKSTSEQHRSPQDSKGT